MADGHDSAHNPASRKSALQQLNRACEACRLSKVRCLVNPASSASSQQCQRCAKARRTCVFAAPAKRRQRKRTDVRVAELEKEVKQMRSLLRNNRISPVETSDYEPMDDEPDEQEEDQPEDESPTTGQSQHITPASTTQSEKWQPRHMRDDCAPKDSLNRNELDIVDRNLISMDMAEEFLDIYRDELTEGCPGVVVPSSWTAAQLRVSKPALFHAVMAAASHFKGLALSNRLHEEVVHLYAKALFIKGEKSLQHVQALLVTVLYYTPPNTPAQLQLYQFGNMAASMALELGLASKPRTHEQLPKRAIRSLQKISSAEELLENCRTILLTYVLTAGLAMRLRRPNILSYNSWMSECLQLLQKSPLLDDKRMVAWLKLQRIADEANTAFGFDDSSTSFSLSELRLQVVLRIFERRMQDWKKSVPQEVMTVSLIMEYYQNMINMCDFAMDGGYYDAPEYRNRHLTLPALDDDCVQPESLLSRSALQINATLRCISAAHSLLDCFLEVNVQKLQKAPNVLFVRVVYAMVALMRVEYAVGTDAEMGEVLDSQSIKVAHYLRLIIQRTSDAIGPQKCRVPSHWLFVVERKLKGWWDEYLQWRKDSKDSKRKPATGEATTAAATTTHPGTTPTAAPFDPTKPSENQGSAPAIATPLSSSEDQAAAAAALSAGPYGPMSSTYSPWVVPANNGATTTTTINSSLDHSAFSPDMADFASAFQNGDLYLWNETNDNFGPWIPQGGSLYTNSQFGGMDGQGF